MMIRNMFVREEGTWLIIGSGLLAEWFESDDELGFGPTLTPWGEVSVRIENPRLAPELFIDADWRRQCPVVDVAVPGFVRLSDVDLNQPIILRRSDEVADTSRTVPSHDGKSQTQTL